MAAQVRTAELVAARYDGDAEAIASVQPLTDIVKQCLERMVEKCRNTLASLARDDRYARYSLESDLSNYRAMLSVIHEAIRLNDAHTLLQKTYNIYTSYQLTDQMVTLDPMTKVHIGKHTALFPLKGFEIVDELDNIDADAFFHFDPIVPDRFAMNMRLQCDRERWVPFHTDLFGDEDQSTYIYWYGCLMLMKLHTAINSNENLFSEVIYTNGVPLDGSDVQLYRNGMYATVFTLPVLGPYV